MLKIDIVGLENTIYQLKKFEPELYSQMTKEIKTEPGLLEVVSGIKARIPTVSPLQGNEFGYGGMVHNGRTSYAVPKVGISSKPSVRLNMAQQRSLVKIEVTSPPNAVGFEIIDLVGRGKNANTRKARGMTGKLLGSPSRYVWKGFEERREGINRAVIAIIQRYSTKVNVKLKVM